MLFLGYDLFPTPLGDLQLISLDDSLIYCNWHHPQCLPKYHHLVRRLGKPIRLMPSSAIISIAKNQLLEYFTGSRKDFRIPLHLIGTPFQKEVWQAIREVSYGKAINYRQLSERSGHPKAFRAVAAACGSNPLAIIVPCHRIISSSATPGGYTGGLEKKLFLLDLEKRRPSDLLNFSESGIPL